MSDNLACEPGAEETPEALRRPDEGPLLEAAAGDDFLGVQAYTRMRVGRAGPLGPAQHAEQTLTGWESWPEALEAAVGGAHGETGLPVLVTESGVSAADDARRIEYVQRALEGTRRCLDDDLPVPGYLYWSALDNFEWVLGYGPTFGLITSSAPPSGAPPAEGSPAGGGGPGQRPALRGSRRPGSAPEAREECCRRAAGEEE